MAIVKSMELSYSDSPSVEVIVVIMEHVKDRNKLSDLKEAIGNIFNTLEENIIIDRPNSPYDCTGQAFTSHIELLNKDISYDDQGYYLRYTYIHRICYDL